MNTPDRARLVALIIAAGAALVTLGIFDPATSGLFPPCPFRALTGWYCPGCGSMRAFHQLLHGNLRIAFALNPFAVTSLPFLAYAMLSHAFRVLRGRGLPRMVLPGAAIRGLAVAIVAFGILRNIPQYPFNLLAPGGLLR
jgi:Protein of unknown function (DUF2752)